MKAMQIKKFGKSQEFLLQEVAKPKIIPKHVLIKVVATSVNPIDLKVRSGAVPAAAPSLPAILQGDVSGVITEVGEELKILRLAMKYMVAQVVLRELVER